MSNETEKSTLRRLHDSRFFNRYFVGHGIDIGAGSNGLAQYKTFFTGIRTVKEWDLPNGDAQHMMGEKDNNYDFVHSSHCLEHVNDPYVALGNWIRICKPGGHLIIVIPDEDLYEQGFWPSHYNHDHKFTFTINKFRSWSPVSINVFNLLENFNNKITVKKVELLDATFKYTAEKYDQTAQGFADSAIEIILQKNYET
jgi:ubiquinone/menaquinone biosynthesis C-methylase UbiE